MLKLGIRHIILICDKLIMNDAIMTADINIIGRYYYYYYYYLYIGRRTVANNIWYATNGITWTLYVL